MSEETTAARDAGVGQGGAAAAVAAAAADDGAGGDAASCLQGGGEMGALMRSLDWAETAVGPIKTWPQSLRTALSILLETKFPMYIAWGADFTQFYNDGYRPILGATKHPAAMGHSTRTTFAEIWDIIGPMFEGVMRGHAVGFTDFMLPLARNGFVEECYFIFSYSPIRDESGGIGGVLVTVTETTPRVLGERRLRTVRDLAACAAAVTDVPAAWQGAARVLSASGADLPFAVLYQLERDGRTARRIGPVEGALATAAPPVITLRGAGDGAGLPDPWSLREAWRSGRLVVIEDLPARLGEGVPPIIGAKWPEPVQTAVVLPIGRPAHERPYGFLLAGVSPRLALDDEYLGFLHLAADQVATAVGNAQMHEEERRRSESLAELDRAKTAFFANVSHEFRTPLTLMLGPMEQALASPGLSLGGEQLRSVHRSALRLLKLVNTLLDFARIEAGRSSACYRPTDLSVLTADLASAFRSAIECAGLRLHVDCPPLGDSVYVDHDQWEKIVLNLISNAFKFTLEGEIRVGLRGCGDHVELVVSDTGTGIPSHELGHVFERFHRIRGARARTYEGSGIGLALVSELVRLHGGSVRVESELGRGSIFTVSIPTGCAHLPADRVEVASSVASTATGTAPFVAEALRWLPDSAPLSQAEDALPALASSGLPLQRDRPRDGYLLVVDDNADMREYLRRLLGSQWTVESAADGREALQLCRRRRPALIVTDVMMPNLDGLSLLRELRADASTASIPMIMLSARAGEEARIEGLRSGVDDYLVKPFSARELTARVETHLALARLRHEAEAARARLYSQFMQAPVPVAVLLGADLIYDLANPLYERMIGRSSIAGRPFLSVFPELDADAPITRMLRDVLASGVPFEAEEYCVPLDREGSGELVEVYFKFRAQPMRDEDDQVFGVMVVAVDVSEQVRARQEIEDARALIEAVVNQMPAGVMIAEAPSGRLLFANQHVRAILGFPVIQTETPDDFQRYPALHRDGRRFEASEYSLVRALAGEVILEEEVLFVRGDGELRVLSVSAAPVRDARGRVIAAVNAFSDITERRQAEQQRAHLLAREREARAEAEVANRAKDEFLALLGHELRNPLSPILTALELMRLRGGDLLKRERTILERQVSHLVRLVDDLLDISRITRGKIELKHERVELGEIVTKAIEMASPLIEQRRHRLHVEVPRSGLCVEGDPVRLAQVVSNLLANAAKYTEAQGSIFVSAAAEDGAIKLVVRDTGIGLRSEIVPHIFDLFFQERQALDRAQGGLGLGLSIVRNLVRLHGGTVTAHSEGLGKGSEFIVRLPAAAPGLAQAPAVARAQRAATKQPEARTPSRAGVRVLVVDDNSDAAALVVEGLSALGYTAQAAPDGPTALAVAPGFRPDLVLLDIGLPIMDGYELARHLRELPELRSVCLVAVTGYGQEKDRASSEAAGIDLHLVRPIRLEQVTEFIEQHLEARRSVEAAVSRPDP